MTLDRCVASLVQYAREYLMLDARDAIYCRNRLLEALGREEYAEEETGATPELPDGILHEIFSALEAEGRAFDRATLGEKLMDAVMLRPSEYEEEFARRYALSPQNATEWAYAYAVHSDYVKKSAIDKNIRWRAQNGLEITINLSKPEKNNADLQKQLTQASTAYPKCTICRENEGYERRGFSRRNMRTLSLPLGGEPWFWQYSPYAYFNEHGIAVSCRHTPMHLDRGTVEKLFDFVEFFPHYFIGNNAPLPRVGGSILMHDHFQGGKETLPMQQRGVRVTLVSAAHPSVKAGVLDWYNSALRMEGGSRDEIASLAEETIKTWERFSAPEADILPFTDGEAHNTASCIARKTEKGYLLDIILRNNRTSQEHPAGIFHAHAEYHPVKSESIGLIEAMGLFILPPRLYRQLGAVKRYLTGACSALEGDTAQFAPMFDPVKNGKTLRDDEAETAIRTKIEDVCTHILENTAVFRRDEAGTKAFGQFLAAAGFKIKEGTL